MAADDECVWALWTVVGLVGWLLVATVAAVVIGRSIRLADRREPDALERFLTEAAENPSLAV